MPQSYKAVQELTAQYGHHDGSHRAVFPVRHTSAYARSHAMILLIHR